MNISLRAAEKLYINGAVIRVDRKTTIEILNDATFLLETHVLQAGDATTPLRQIYFALQVMLMDPSSAPTALAMSRKLIASAQRTFESPKILAGLKAISEMVARSRILDAMKGLRALFPTEQEIMFPPVVPKQVEATEGAQL
jgi:flagellar biosynthesis repressor protein FlbT